MATSDAENLQSVSKFLDGVFGAPKLNGNLHFTGQRSHNLRRSYNKTFPFEDIFFKFHSFYTLFKYAAIFRKKSRLFLILMVLKNGNILYIHLIMLNFMTNLLFVSTLFFVSLVREINGLFRVVFLCRHFIASTYFFIVIPFSFTNNFLVSCIFLTLMGWYFPLKAAKKQLESHENMNNSWIPRTWVDWWLNNC